MSAYFTVVPDRFLPVSQAGKNMLERASKNRMNVSMQFINSITSRASIFPITAMMQPTAHLPFPWI